MSQGITLMREILGQFLNEAIKTFCKAVSMALNGNKIKASSIKTVPRQGKQPQPLENIVKLLAVIQSTNIM